MIQIFFLSFFLPDKFVLKYDHPSLVATVICELFELKIFWGEFSQFQPFHDKWVSVQIWLPF